MDQVWKQIPIEFQTEATRNTLDYVYTAIGHKCTFIIKQTESLTQIIVNPKKISNHYRQFLPKTYKKNQHTRLLHCIVKEFKQTDTEGWGTLSLFKAYEHAGHTIPNGIYVVTPTDALIYRKNFKDPFYHVTGSSITPIRLKHPLLPILAWSGHKDYLDVPIANIDDMGYILKERGVLDMSKVELDFSKKKPLAVFRGGSTGCGWTPDSNPRLKAVKLSQAHPTLLDAQLTDITGSWKIHKTRRAGRINKSEFRLGSSMPFEHFSHYKYILQLDGNVAAYRLARSMLLGSTILLQESGSILWFQHLMKPWVHYVPIKDTLHDLIDQIEWCKKHESECKLMAEHARTLALKVLTKETLFEELHHAIDESIKIARNDGKI